MVDAYCICAGFSLRSPTTFDPVEDLPMLPRVSTGEVASGMRALREAPYSEERGWLSELSAQNNETTSSDWSNAPAGAALR